MRERVIGDGFGEQISVQNYTTSPERARLTLSLDADYADIFELRGLVRDRRGERLPTRGDGEHIEFGYRGVDGAERRTHIRIEPADDARRLRRRGTRERAGRPRARFDPRAGRAGDARGRRMDRGAARRRGRRIPSAAEIAARCRWTKRPRARVRTSAPTSPRRCIARGDRARHRSRPATCSPSEHWSAPARIFGCFSTAVPGEGERYVAAGVPWFSCLFGRDSLITSLQLLCVRPQIARSTLSDPRPPAGDRGR